MDPLDFKERRNVLADKAKALGLDTVMICDPVNITYLTGAGITPYERFLSLLLNVSSKKWRLVMPALEQGAHVDSGIERRYYADDQNPFHLAVEVMGPGNRLGVEKTHMTLARMEGLMAAAGRSGIRPDELIDLDDLAAGLRMIKAPAEIERLKAAARAGDLILEQIKPMIKPGVTEKRIVAEMIRAMSEIPGVSIDEPVILVLAGSKAANPHGCPGDRRIAPGDPVLIDFGVHRDGYWSDCTRTFFAGPPDERLKVIYQTVWEAQKAAIDAAAPGVPMGEIDRAAREVIERAGYGPWFNHRVGHGLGLSIHEAPSLHGNNRNSLESGMVFTIEPGIYPPELGGVRIEDDILVQGDGATNLTGYAKSFEAMVLPM